MIGDPVFRADCARCAGLCCVVPAFARSSDFAIDKPAGTPCPNLEPDRRCRIHEQLRPRGFAGCAVYDCFGAGQLLTQAVFGGRPLDADGALDRRLVAAFPVVRAIQELRSYLHEATAWSSSGALRASLESAAGHLEALTGAHPDELARLEVDELRGQVNPLLVEASRAARRGEPAFAVEHRGADLSGSSLRGRDLRGASLRGTLLLGADLRAADLRRADVLGADLRGAELGGADLRGALFLTRSQLEAARGDGATRLDPWFGRPAHW